MFTDAVIETQQDQVTGSVRAISRKAEMLVIPFTLTGMPHLSEFQMHQLLKPGEVIFFDGYNYGEIT